MKLGDLVEWLEQALNGAVEAQKLAAPSPTRTKWPDERDVEQVARILGHRDVSARRSAASEAICMQATCAVGHDFWVEFDELRIWSQPRREQMEWLVRELSCPRCRSI